MAFRPNQISCAEEIIERFSGDVHRYCLLVAPCQSGKTGTFHKVAQLALSERLVDRVYLLCGSQEIVLKKQAIDDTLEYNRLAYDNKSFEIIFHSDFKKQYVDTRRSLIILDESHMDQGKNQKLIEFALANSFDFAGTNSRMIEEDTYILSVSATPYSELSDIYHKITPRKFISYLTPGDNYIGIDYYLLNNHIHDTFKIGTEWNKFKDLVLSYGARFNLIRLRDDKKDDGALATILSNASSSGIDILYYTQDKCEIAITNKEKKQIVKQRQEQVIKTFNINGKRHTNEFKEAFINASLFPCLENKPKRPTLVILKGKLRAGKVVPKQNIGFVWENSSNPATDTAVQGLLGRMCGYYEDDVQIPHIYLTKNLFKDANTIVSNNELFRHIFMPTLMMPKKGSNLKETHLTVSKELNPCVPLLCKFDEEEDPEEWISYLYSIDESKLYKDVIASKILEKLPSLIESHNHLTIEQKEELLSIHPLLRIGGKSKTSIHFRHLDEKSSNNHANFFNNVKIAAENGLCPTEHISDNTYLSILIVHQNNRIHGLKSGDILLYFNTKYVNTPKINLKQRFPETTGNEMFRVRLTKEEKEGAVAGLALYLRDTIRSSPEKLKKQLDSILQFSEDQKLLGEEGLIVSTILSKREKNVFINLDKTAYNWISNTNNDFNRILLYISQKFNVILTPKYKIDPSKHSKFVLLDSISWE